MKILIDGDACSRIAVTERIAKQKRIPCHIYCDASRNIESNYSKVHIVDIGTNSADMAIIKHCDKGDIVITNDTSLAAMALARTPFVMNNYGQEFTTNNIMCLLTAKYIRQTSMRKTGKRPTKQTQELYGKAKKHASFAQTLNTLIKKAMED